MADINQNIEFYVGDDVPIFLVLRATDGSALNLTGCTLRWALARFGSTTPLITKSSSTITQIEVTSAAGGLATVYLSDTDTAALSAGGYQHEVELTDASGNKETLATGQATVNATILN